jgi:hypothetical protein
MFGVIAVVSVLGLFLVLSFRRFRSSAILDKKKRSGSIFSIYFYWLGMKMSAFFRTSWIKRFPQLYREWIIERYSPSVRWMFVCLGISYAYLAASGFVFSLLGSARLQGVFLLLHVAAGGLFAVCLSLAVVLRARYYRLDDVLREVQDASPNLKTKPGIRKLWLVTLFWLFVFSSLGVMVSALGQMLSGTSLGTQVDLFEAHRYSALVSLLSALALFDHSRIEENR